MTCLKGMTHDEVKAFERGHELVWKGLRTTCLFALVKPGGGAGMGDYPETAFAVFQNGLVLSSDPWARPGVVQTYRPLDEDGRLKF